MAKTYSKKDIFDGKLFDEAINEANQMIKVLEVMDTKIVQLSNTYKTTLNSATTNNKKGIEDIIKVSNELNVVTEQANKIEKDKIATSEKLRKAEIDQAKAYEQFTKEVQKRQAIEEKAHAKREAQYNKEIKQVQELSRPYNVLSKQLNELRKDYKDMAVAGEENTTQAIELKKQIIELDAELKKVDATVGQHTRNVGNYEGAVKPLKTQLREMTQILQSMDESDPRFAKMAAEAGQLRDKINDTKDIINATAGTGVENLSKGFANAGKIGINAMQGVEGAMALFGVESENVMQVLVRLQALSALTDAIEGLGALGDTMNQIKASFSAAAVQLGLFTTAKEVDTVVTEGQIIATETATVTTNGLGKAMKALPIIALIAGVSTLVALFIDWGNESTALERKQQALNDTMDEYKNAATEATSKTNEVKIAFQLAKEGVISKGEALKIYNDTLGETMGTATSLNEAEKLFVEKTEAYIKASALRAQADAIIKMAAQAKVDALLAEVDAQKMAVNAAKDADNIISGFISNQAPKMALASADKNKIRANELEDLSLDLLRQAELLENNNGIMSTSEQNYNDEVDEMRQQNADKEKERKDKEVQDTFDKNAEELRIYKERLELERGMQEAEDAWKLEQENAIKDKQLSDEEKKRKEEEELSAWRIKTWEWTAEQEKKAEEQRLKDAEDRRKRMQEIRQKSVNDALDEMKQISTEKQKSLDKEIEAEKKQQDALQAQANAGNIDAQNSIKASIEAQKQATVEKQKEVDKQRRYDELKMLYNLIESKIEKGDGAIQATGKSMAEMAIIKGAAKLLSGFKKGTKKRVQDEMKPNVDLGSDPDNRIIRVAGDEAILTGEKMDLLEKFGIHTTDDIVNNAIKAKVNIKQDVAGNSYDLLLLQTELKSIKDAILNKPETNIELGLITQNAMEIIERRTQGNKTTTNAFKVK